MGSTATPAESCELRGRRRKAAGSEMLQAREYNPRKAPDQKNRTLKTIPEVHNTRNRSPADATELLRVEQKALQFEVYSLSRGYGALWVWGSDSCGSKLRFRVPDVVGFN